MYINLRLLDSSNQQNFIKYQCQSVNETISKLRKSCLRIFDAHSDVYVRLFYGGKELNDSLTLLDYGIKINDLVQVLIRKNISPILVEEKEEINNYSKKSKKDDINNQQIDSIQIEKDEYYRVGDHVNCLHPDLGAFFEGKIVKICKNLNQKSSTEEKIFYEIKFNSSSLTDSPQVNIDKLQPLFNKRIFLSQVRVNDVILVNYNLNDSSLLGYWYNYHVNRVTKKHLIGDLQIGCDVFINNQTISGDHEMFKVFPNRKRNQLNKEELNLLINGPKERRLTAAECDECNDNPDVDCTECACSVCGSKSDPEKQVYCDECNNVYHFKCHPTPLNDLPEDDWYCHLCRNDDRKLIQYKEEEKILNRKRKRTTSLHSSSSTETKYNWGHGISCIGRTIISDSVPKDYFGSIPNIHVGTWWRFRFQASEAGVHTPLVAGIHGKENLGAFSVVFCCGYDDDVDLGDEIYYTGSGGKQREGNKSRVGGAQVKDQELKRCNKALAMNCAVQFSEFGANSGDNWRSGKPVRVLRSGNARGSSKKSPYLPKLGVRYDGLYKVVKYWSERNDKNLLVWRFLLRRDDSTPSPWTKEGRRRIKKIGLQLTNPPGYEEKNVPRKRKSLLNQNNSNLPIKRFKSEPFKLSNKVRQLISLDIKNQTIWTQLLDYLNDKKTFISRLEEAFKCGCCLDIVCQPMTTNCGHNICKECIKHSLKSDVNTCPICRSDITSKMKKPKLNHNLMVILSELIINYKERTNC